MKKELVEITNLKKSTKNTKTLSNKELITYIQSMQKKEHEFNSMMESLNEDVQA